MVCLQHCSTSFSTNLEQSNVVVNRLTQTCGYADDILVNTRSLPALEALCVEISREAGRVGVVINQEKTKYMRFSASPSRRSVKGATIKGVTDEGVAELIYLGTLISNDNSLFWPAIELILQLCVSSGVDFYPELLKLYYIRH